MRTQASGPIAPGSPMFQGREEELLFIRETLTSASILIAGSHRIGSTSLLNQAFHWAARQKDLVVCRLNLLGVQGPAGFQGCLAQALEGKGNTSTFGRVGPDARSLEGLVRLAERTNRLPVFFLNEIDGLLEGPSIKEWRQLDGDNRARFIMVGCSAILESFNDGPLSFAVGNGFHGRAVTPKALSKTAAQRLVSFVLTSGSSPLPWQDEATETAALEKLLTASYRIPCFLQLYCRELEKLSVSGRGQLTLKDVEAVLRRHGDEVWRRIVDFNYQPLNRDGIPNLAGCARWVLDCLARDRYFLKESRIDDEPWLEENPGVGDELAFGACEAKEIVLKTVKELVPPARQEFLESYFVDVEFRRLLRLLTLTMALEAHPQAPDRFGFLMHIYPRELRLRCRKPLDPRLDVYVEQNASEIHEV